MKKGSVLIIILFLSSGVFAQQAQIKVAAQQMADGLKTGDFKSILDYTEPRAVALAGGRDSMKKVIDMVLSQLKAQGLTMEDAKVGEPGDIVKLENIWYCIVPEILKIGVPKTEYHAKGMLTAPSSMLAVSLDAGKNWYFVNSGSMTDDAVVKIYPELKGKITLPKHEMPTFTATP